MTESDSPDAPTSSHDPLDQADAAVEAGDWATARSILANLDASTLEDGVRARYDKLQAQLRPDRLAIAIAVVLGVGLLAIVLALYM